MHDRSHEACSSPHDVCRVADAGTEGAMRVAVAGEPADLFDRVLREVGHDLLAELAERSFQ